MTPDQLKEWRENIGYSQNKLATVLGVDVMTVSRWERGVSTIPSFLHLTLECVGKKKGGELRSRVLKKTERRKK